MAAVVKPTRLPPLLHQLRTLPAASRPHYSRKSPSARSYYSHEHPSPEPFPPIESSILSASLVHVPAHGFSETALQLGARDAGYLPASLQLFPRGAFDLINYYLIIQRLALKDHVQFPDETTGVAARVRTLMLERLRANKDIIHQWQDVRDISIHLLELPYISAAAIRALALMALPSHLRPSLTELANLADEIWYLAGDTSIDETWYTKRASLATIYSAADLFMTQDTSTDFTDTETFLDRRLEDVNTVGGTLRDVGEWAGFQAAGLVNLLRSKGMPL
ncbi:MAG: Ubiquinone biosynthesis protein coq9, mitochondrial [Cirrosporium novae-zelandiae]|nr:MAG: Ubiquinone biosynthesis protein coq9, mitochondrial [Cirrosporium novae-zelandiae]